MRIVFSGEIAQHAVSNSTKAVTKFRSSSSSDSESKFDPKTWSRAAGLQFPVSVIGVYLGRFTGKYVNPDAAVYLAAVLEYISAEILELSGNAASDLRMNSITPHHLALTFLGDEELEKMLSDVTYVGKEGSIIHLDKHFLHLGLDSRRKAKPDEEEGLVSDISKFLNLDTEVCESGGVDVESICKSYGTLLEEDPEHFRDNIVPRPKVVRAGTSFGSDDLAPLSKPAEAPPAEKGGSVGLGPGGAKRHRRVFRDNIQLIDCLCIAQIMIRAGVPRWHGLVYHELRGIITVWLHDVFRDAIMNMEHCRRRVVSVEDVQMALLQKGTPVMGMGQIQKCLDATVDARSFDNPDCVTTTANRELWIEAAKQEAAALVAVTEEKEDEDKDKEDEDEDEDIGSPSPLDLLVKVRRLQNRKAKERVCAFSFNQIMPNVREVSQDYKTDLIFEPAVFKMISVALENHIVKLVSNAARLTTFAGREFLECKDIQFARRTMR